MICPITLGPDPPEVHHPWWYLFAPKSPEIPEFEKGNSYAPIIEKIWCDADAYPANHGKNQSNEDDEENHQKSPIAKV